jgi:hypothetical protein
MGFYLTPLLINPFEKVTIFLGTKCYYYSVLGCNFTVIKTNLSIATKIHCVLGCNEHSDKNKPSDKQILKIDLLNEEKSIF